MSDVIDLIKRNDPTFRKFCEEGTETNFDDDLVTFRESTEWK